MKIYTVAYDELGDSPSTEDVIKDIVEYFASIDDCQREELGTVLISQLKELTEKGTAEVIWVDTTKTNRPYIAENLRKQDDIDLLVTYNLAGFELSTLTDGLAYNLVDCRQFHFIKNEICSKNEVLNKQRSINMFIVERL